MMVFVATGLQYHLFLSVYNSPLKCGGACDDVHELPVLVNYRYVKMRTLSTDYIAE